MVRSRLTTLLSLLLLMASGDGAIASQPAQSSEQFLVTAGEIGRPGGRLVASLRADPKSLNPVTAVDLPSKQVQALLFADLIHINAYTQQTEPALAASWKVSRDGKRYTLQLRRGILFSDGEPFDADDVVFSFKVYLDEKVHSPQRDLLQVGGKPITVRKAGQYQIIVDLPQPYAAAERIFDSVSILPRHLLQRAYDEGKISQVWSVTTDPRDIAGLGPFRLSQYTPGQQIVLERNPHYWKTDPAKTRLPYLDELVFLIVPTQDAEVIRFQAGEIDVLDNISSDNYNVLMKSQRGHQLQDLGAGFEYDFLFFNLNDLGSKFPEIARKQQWFRRDEFRQAIATAIDRDAIVRLAYQGRATPLWEHVTPGNKLWTDSAIPHPVRSLEKAAALLQAAGFRRRADGILVDAKGAPVEFSILTNPDNAQRAKIATIIQDDLAHLGIQVHVVPLEFRSLITRVFDSFDYEAAVLGLVSGDADPNPEINVWTSGGGTHIWAPNEVHPLTPWQSELDRLMQLQTTVLNYRKRKQIYDRVQELVAQYDPVICLISPNVLVAYKNSLGGARPAVLRNHMLWNAEQIFWQQTVAGKR